MLWVYENGLGEIEKGGEIKGYRVMLGFSFDGINRKKYKSYF